MDFNPFAVLSAQEAPQDETQALQDLSKNVLGPDQAKRPGGKKRHTVHKPIVQYFLKEVPIFRKLTELRVQVCGNSPVAKYAADTPVMKGWKNNEGDRYFEKQRYQADNATEERKKTFFEMMQMVARELQNVTKAFSILVRPGSRPRILDMCMAPGGLLTMALAVNPNAEATAFSLPEANGGHKSFIPQTSRIKLEFLDITMLSEDMGVSDIPTDHPESDKFLSRRFDAGKNFDLVICDGTVLRTHRRAAYREHCEGGRLMTSQLALGLEHLRPGGTMVVLLHKLEAWKTASLLHRFSKFSSVRLFKPRSAHAARSSFYLVAKNVMSRSKEATVAVQQWKHLWKLATFGTGEEYVKAAKAQDGEAEVLLEMFGEDLIRLGRTIWRIQANALAQCPFIRSG